MSCRHMRIDVKGAISNGVGWQWVTADDGRPATKREAVAWLLEQLAQGRRFLPIGKCEGFDFATGECPGHPDEG